jgi:hypothetical protein
MCHRDWLNVWGLYDLSVKKKTLGYYIVNLFYRVKRRNLTQQNLLWQINFANLKLLTTKVKKSIHEGGSISRIQFRGRGKRVEKIFDSNF